jgi:hypothetical protein
MSRKFAVVTTFNKAGMDLYGQKMIDSFEKNWPAEVDLYVYAEGCTPNKTRNNTYVRELMQNAGIVKFKAKWKDVPKANGLENPKGRVDSHKGFKWDAIRFCHKVFAIFDCAKSLDGSGVDELIWMDADTLCHSVMPNDFLDKFIPHNSHICYFSREPKWPECGFYSMKLKEDITKKFLSRFQWVYDHAEEGIFTMKEWHDSFVFYEIVKEFRQVQGFVEHSLSNVTIQGEGHPIINSKLGAYIDHMKGNRKVDGKSYTKDLKVERKEDYWK